MASAWERTHAFALTYPGAWEDHPWGEVVVKVNKKIFVFLGHPEGTNKGMTVKLPESRDHALALPGSEVPGYGLGKQGLTGSGRSNQKYAFRNFGADAAELARIAQEFYFFLQFLFGFSQSGYIFEADLGHIG